MTSISDAPSLTQVDPETDALSDTALEALTDGNPPATNSSKKRNSQPGTTEKRSSSLLSNQTGQTIDLEGVDTATTASGSSMIALKAKSKRVNIRSREPLVEGDGAEFAGQDEGYDEGYSDGDDDEDDDEEGSSEEEDEGLDEDYIEDEEETDDMWEDAEEEEEDEDGLDSEEMEELERQREERLEAELEAAEDERLARLAAIAKKKGIIIERYLKTAKMMIRQRKKNIYLQDYLYHLALRKGVLRGDKQTRSSTLHGDGTESKESLAMNKKEKKKNKSMVSRFSRFLRRSGHLMDDEKLGKSLGHHHHYHRMDPIAIKRKTEAKARINRRRRRHKPTVVKLNGGGDPKKTHHHGHRRYSHKRGRLIPSTLILTATGVCPDCPMGAKTRATIRQLRHHNQRHDIRIVTRFAEEDSQESLSSGGSDGKRNAKKPRNLQEFLKYKAKATVMQALKTQTDEAIEAFERHRCRLAKNKKQLVNIVKLLLRAYSGADVLFPERDHLISFVEKSVRAQSLARKKAARRMDRDRSKGHQPKATTTYLTHQWNKSLEKLGELRMTMAKMEHKHRLVLIRKVKSWQEWESKNCNGLIEVLSFVTKFGSQILMTTTETMDYRESINQFEKQLYTLHNAMLAQVIKRFRCQSSLCMLQRRLKDSDSAETPQVKGFTIGDFERMRLENKESHGKLMERHEHLLDEYNKLKTCIKHVADEHLKRQMIYGTLRVGHHDSKRLYEMCLLERENLEDKIEQIRKTEKLQRQLFRKIAIVQNKRLLNDFINVNHEVRELKDQGRYLSTQLHQLESILRMRRVRWEDTQQRSRVARDECANNLQNTGYGCKDSIKERLAPKIPQTIHGVNMNTAAFPKRTSCGKVFRPPSKPHHVGTKRNIKFAGPS